MIEETHKKGTICYRCGSSKADYRKERFVCNTGYASHETHLWNKEPVITKTYSLTLQ